MDEAKVKRWYEAGFWKDSMVQTAVRKGKLTAEQYERITGKKWEAEDNE